MRYMALDIGNVCCSIDPARCFLRLGTVPSAELLLTVREFETGKFGEAEFLRRARAGLPGISLSDAELREAFNAILISPVPGMAELVRSMPGMGIVPVFFSDISCTHLARFRELFPAAEGIPGIYSFEAGAQKPGEAMFRAFEEKYGVPCFYTDDRAELIEAARKRGWNAEVFAGPGKLKEILTAPDFMARQLS